MAAPTARSFPPPVGVVGVTRFLLATDSVHTTAAACDYLADRLDDGDEVQVIAVDAGEGDARDADDALNVAATRLAGLASVGTTRTEGDPVDAILDAAAEEGASEIILGARSGAPGTDTELGATARAVLERVSIPAVVVPVPRLD